MSVEWGVPFTDHAQYDLYKKSRNPQFYQNSPLKDIEVLWGTAYGVIVAQSKLDIGFNSFSRAVCDATILLTAKANGDLHVGFSHLLPGERDISSAFINEMKVKQGWV